MVTLFNGEEIGHPMGIPMWTSSLILYRTMEWDTMVRTKILKILRVQ